MTEQPNVFLSVFGQQYVVLDSSKREEITEALDGLLSEGALTIEAWDAAVAGVNRQRGGRATPPAPAPKAASEADKVARDWAKLTEKLFKKHGREVLVPALREWYNNQLPEGADRWTKQNVLTEVKVAALKTFSTPEDLEALLSE
ncbi:hypothetical protein nbrc107696_42690 [Gordonia spumicola]|uniref:Uncharacterized protein n=1 Tax=Gordonia spumicola TaxID=589161 RepID=A0A7I9VFD5_9ACTN|nr:hypothetical protein [Gordonia spumicola]GEE03823.1 hypothetical protein nbrc107696_42690 [Gordonia spumicola]